jgi:hypothetical protein
MGKSDEYIDFKAYLRYLGKVTGEPADPDRLRNAVLARTEERTELQTALSLLKSLSVAAAIVLVCALGAAGLGYASAAGGDKAGRDKARENEAGEELWSRARVEDRGPRGVVRLYDAYEHSKEIREKFYRECL